MHSLKDKRAVVRPIVEGMPAPLWRRRGRGGQARPLAGGGARVRGRFLQPGHVAEVLDSVERFVWSFPEVEVVTCERHWWGD